MVVARNAAAEGACMFFKKKITSDEFGRLTASWANEFLVNDGAVSLSRFFDEFYDKDRERDGEQFLDRMGVPPPKTNLYIRLFSHCAIQAASTQFGRKVGKAITMGAMSNYVKTPTGYDFESTYSALDAIYSGRHRFGVEYDALSNPGFDFPVLPNPDSGILNAKFLIDDFMFSNLSQALLVRAVSSDGFKVFSGSVCGGLNIALRAMAQLSKSARII
jgi:hypothetical protein